MHLGFELGRFTLSDLAAFPNGLHVSHWSTKLTGKPVLGCTYLLVLHVHNWVIERWEARLGKEVRSVFDESPWRSEVKRPGTKEIAAV